MDGVIEIRWINWWYWTQMLAFFRQRDRANALDLDRISWNISEFTENYGTRDDPDSMFG
jgi:hypothetical protein